ncbi:hypothetical protein A1Q1_02724 [Trichosporon asahii var. asahii CBS 2479]|uniref:Uncharacterized protein n=1 Tax=Trichosporon asahii var. asahii (strain ATCC 90039 / CBS 2479 / JCM 2466 / KCTC 7840 / NBRC 103889/ NCYC 2677 / UAMH 7654) TaxID=1186058 RepID=J5SYT0_TRIAS|nr:hypothetical protein A1Q1_02724 [Trichosporon asahii var. asahii CBS 2479]EJT48256.1 hypothetical protein A1Q1_02724 [Trichosporon asahii var. asahii CBS 2479]
MPAQVLRDYHTYSEQRLRSVGDAAVERGQQTFSEARANLDSSRLSMAEQPALKLQSPSGDILYEVYMNRFPTDLESHLSGVLTRLQVLNLPFQQHVDGSTLVLVATVDGARGTAATAKGRYVLSGSWESARGR